jgi:SAM-dependent methyltransferase
MPTKQQIKDWYNRRYASRGLESMRPPEAYSLFLDHLDPKPGGRLLDVSCGVGFLLREASRRGVMTVGVDLSQEAIRHARETSPTSLVAVGRGEELALAGRKFDYVTCMGSLEHFLDMDQGLREMRRVARPGATFCLMVPNSRYLFWLMKGRRGTEQQDLNENLMPLNGWKRLFLQNGFEILHVNQDRWFQRTASNPLRRLIWKWMPLRFTYQFIFILKQRDTA